MAKEAVCVECGEYKEILAKDMCKRCYERCSYKRNREIVLKRQRKYNEKNSKTRSEYNKEWRKKNKRAKAALE
jgi:hypothetical protein